MYGKEFKAPYQALLIEEQFAILHLNQTIMTDIPEQKAELHLKLGRKLAVFVGIGQYFEQKTFDWVLLEKAGLQYRATLTRSFSEGDEFFNDVMSFGTVNELESEDEAESYRFQGDLAACLAWIRTDLKPESLKIITPHDLDLHYSELVKKGAFGNG